MPWLWAAAHAAALAVALLLPPPGAAAVVAAAAASALAGRRHWHRRAHPPRRLEPGAGGWRLHRAGREPVAATVAAAHAVAPGILVLRLRLAGEGRYALVVRRAEVGAAAFGRLRVALGLA
ncbi:hypothetical protein [Inmirania thermothiophila]|uniref:hypothetical protein n=1 Tax=Inmirania thermothiophila TaxID=1750597 RepID=UPI000F46BD8F|nr:hypothetical protein [Inmirania thermothiophila]